MPLLALGLNHKTAPIEIRERVAFDDREISPTVVALQQISGVNECLLLSTCNRTEVYLAAAGASPIDRVTELLGAARSIAVDAFAPCLYAHEGARAARHALQVAAGLDSMVVGEEQILGQVRRAFDVARLAGTTGPILSRLAQLAIATGRRVRRETGLSRYAPSVPRAALARCEEALGSVRGRPVMIVGAGDMGTLTAKVFSAAGARITAVANRTPQGAHVLAARVGAQVVPLEDLAQAAGDVDILVVCAGAATPVVTRAMLESAGRAGTPLLLMDLGIPRGVDPEVVTIPGVTLQTLDALAGKEAGAAVPPEHVVRAERIVEDALGQFETWMASRAAVPVITALRRQAEAIVAAEMARARPRLRDLDADQREAVYGVVEAVTRKLLQTPMVRLRESAARADRSALRSARTLFGLDVPDADAGGDG